MPALYGIVYIRIAQRNYTYDKAAKVEVAFEHSLKRLGILAAPIVIYAIVYKRQQAIFIMT